MMSRYRYLLILDLPSAGGTMLPVGCDKIWSAHSVRSAAAEEASRCNIMSNTCQVAFAHVGKQRLPLPSALLHLDLDPVQTSHISMLTGKRLPSRLCQFLGPHWRVQGKVRPWHLKRLTTCRSQHVERRSHLLPSRSPALRSGLPRMSAARGAPVRVASASPQASITNTEAALSSDLRC